MNRGRYVQIKAGELHRGQGKVWEVKKSGEWVEIKDSQSSKMFTALKKERITLRTF